MTIIKKLAMAGSVAAFALATPAFAAPYTAPSATGTATVRLYDAITLDKVTDVDFGVVATPDSGGVFLYGMDVFAVPAGAKHNAEALDWIRTIASPDGQIAFNEYKGSSPVRLSMPNDGLDPMAQGIYSDFQSSTRRIPGIALPQPWDDGFIQLAKDHDRQALLKVFLDNPIAM